MAVSRAAAVSAWLQAVAAEGWAQADVDKAAQLSGLSPAELLAAVGDQTDALSAFLADLEAVSTAAAAGPGSVRDRLFDGMMAGFDRLQAERRAALALLDSRDPGLLARTLGHAAPGLRRLFAAAGGQTAGLDGALRLAALSAIAARALHVWRRDESPDMAATMAEVDRLLARAERVAQDGPRAAFQDLPGLESLARLNPFDRGRQSSPDPRAE